MSEPKRILVFGAEGATGREVVRQAVAQGHHVRASDREFQIPEALPDDVEAVPANVLESDLCPVIRGVDAVISCLGVPNDPRSLLDPPPLYVDGTARIVQAMQAEQVRRIVVISASFVVARDRGPLLFRTAVIPSLTRVLDQMKGMEAVLRVSGLDWTAVRPGWLMKGEPSPDPWIGPDVIPSELIRTRIGDLAALLLDCAVNGTWVGATPAIARDEPDFEESSTKVILEMLA
ncbi:NAD-dependent epimerase/dehydratase family protein [Rubellimicrobium rubrum]|uniref:NAD-dependent epimerase/dehydratase family protein n=1 Tax=Rubellimicrobium rubrum TaxID=2585369 RepID=A0A5C4MVX9_9RHOB|nr:NAD(P)H-binding protein [Rubellimicrobium rubrum]TNC48028.1 NAD-dependent epimerase/dehydratase family protein [Rubellimicrobium rubrum]